MKKTIIQLVANNTSCIRRDHARILVGAVVACWLIAAGTAQAQFSENFDAYANGSQAIGQGGWQGWDGDTTVGGLVTNAFAFSAPNSVRIRGTALTSGNYSDLVHQFAGISSGQWSFTAKQYIPGNSTGGTSYFIVMSRYADGNPGGNTDVWGSQMTFNLATGGVSDANGGSTATPTIIRDQWVDLRLDIDLTANTVSEYYNNQLFRTATWATGTPPGIQAIDLYSDVSSPVFYDNISLTRVRTVTTTASTGPGSLTAAINALSDGDTIAFNIPGAEPHYITGPVGGFGVITKNGVTIDGYTQPGSSVNTSTILGSNNAVIKIVIRGTDTRTGPDATTVTNGSVAGFTDLTAAGIAGFTDSESALVAFSGASDITVRGLCFLGDWAALPNGDDNPPGPAESQYAISFGGNGTSANCHVSGCRFGLDPDNVTVGRLKDGVAWFGAGVDNLTIGVAAGPANAAAARAQFNIFMGMYIALIGDLGPVRISGNFFNVYPDGLHDYNVSNRDGDVDHSLEAFFEQSASGSSILIGTDGDGLNDAEERNIFGGVTDCGDRRILEWYGGAPSKYVIAGNYFGLGVDGVTRFTNGGPRMEVVETFKFGPAQFGSDFNGVSDALEGNVISWNYPFATLYPAPSDPTAKTTYDKFRFANNDAGSVLAVRGNSFIGMESPPITYFGRPSDDAGRLTTYSNRVAQFMAPTGDYDTFYPQLSASSSSTHLIGSCAPGFNGYDQAIVIDVYKADPEGWVNGMKFAFANLIVGGVTNGFPQGKTYVGSLRDNGPYDLNAAVGGFDFNLGAAGLVLSSSDFVTVTANYFDTALTGTAVGATDVAPHTSNFSHPIGLGPILIGSATLGGGGTTLTINWTGGAPPYTLQKKSTITGGWSTVQTGIIGPPATVTISGSEGYYRVVGN